jgi:DNA-directed RNA polymerase specialized sigma24 family protein
MPRKREPNKYQLTKERLEALLDALDMNREKAISAYETMQKKLIKYFEWNGCWRAEECADETIDRVAMKIEELGKQIRAADKFSFALGVAIHVLQEYAKQARNLVADDGRATKVANDDHEASESEMITLLKECIEWLVPKQRDLIRRYYWESDQRVALAEELGLTMNGLYTEAFRVKEALHDCMKRKRKQFL